MKLYTLVESSPCKKYKSGLNINHNIIDTDTRFEFTTTKDIFKFLEINNLWIQEVEVPENIEREKRTIVGIGEYFLAENIILKKKEPLSLGTIKRLISQGADITIKLYYWAVLNNRFETFKYVVNLEKPELNHLKLMLVDSCKKGYTNFVKFIIKTEPELINHDTAFLESFKSGKVHLVDYFLKSGYEIKKELEKKILENACISDNIDLFKRLLRKGIQFYLYDEHLRKIACQNASLNVLDYINYLMMGSKDYYILSTGRQVYKQNALNKGEFYFTNIKDVFSFLTKTTKYIYKVRIPKNEYINVESQSDEFILKSKSLLFENKRELDFNFILNCINIYGIENINHKDKLLEWACANKKNNIIKFLVNLGVDIPKNLLRIASEFENNEIINYLLSSKKGGLKKS